MPLLGGITYISSSGIIAKVLDDLDRLGNRETPAILSLPATEDLAMAVFLPLIAVALAGGGVPSGLVAAVTMLTTLATGWLATRDCAAPGRLRAGTALMARGELSVVIADLGVAAGLQARLGPLAVTYVLATAVLGPLATRWAGTYRAPRWRPPGRDERGWRMRPR